MVANYEITYQIINQCDSGRDTVSLVIFCLSNLTLWPESTVLSKCGISISQSRKFVSISVSVQEGSPGAGTEGSPGAGTEV